jgi:hypothetical protein
MNGKNFRVYLNDCAGHWIVIITVVDMSDDLLYSEYFILVQDKEECFVAMSTPLQKGRPPEHELEWERRLALDAATLKVRQHFMNEYSRTKDEFYRHCARERKNVIEDDDGYGLRSLYQGGMFANELKLIQAKSRCQSLQEHIHWIERAPRWNWQTL